MDFYKAVNVRRSVRKYLMAEVEQAQLDRILDAARLAPSAANVQPWRFFVVRNAETKKRLQAAYPPEWFHTAPVIIIGCVDTAAAWHRSDGKSYADVDIAIAMEHIMLAAAAEGLGTCWIGAFNPKVVRDILQLPAQVEPVAMTPLGHPADSRSEKQRKSLNEIVTFVD